MGSLARERLIARIRESKGCDGEISDGRRAPHSDAYHSRGLTQEQVAELLGMEGVSIVRVEQGRKTPRTSTLHRLSEIYDVHMAELDPKPDDSDKLAG